MKKKFLVLGSNSFSGSNFINFILNKNCNVVGISRSYEYKKIYLPYKKSSSLRFFKFYKININTNLRKLKSILLDFQQKQFLKQKYKKPELQIL